MSAINDALARLKEAEQNATTEPKDIPPTPKAKAPKAKAKAKAKPEPKPEPKAPEAEADVDPLGKPTSAVEAKATEPEPFAQSGTLELVAQHKGQTKNGKWEVYEVRQAGVTNLLYLRSAPADTIRITLEASE